MNTQKKKNKNRPKSQNPLPPQNIEVGEKDDESASVVDKPEVQVKTEERVPEILSEVVTVPVGDTKEGDDNESPKKPKRNRGKKKKGDKGEPGDIAESTVSTGEAAEDMIVSDIKVDNKAKKQQEVTKSDDSNMPITPTSRKKKVKNKGQESFEKVLVPEVKSDISEFKNEPVVEKGSNLKVSELQEQESKSGKKKNKKTKKNRNDSEKTDDLSCTSAFQKIIQDVTESEVKNEGVTEVVEEGIEKSLNKSIGIRNAETSSQIVDTQKDEGSKNKKKNKKDKKQPPKEEEIPDEKLTPTQLFNISQDVKPMTFVMELPEDKDEVIEIRDEDSNIVIANADVIDNATVSITKEQSPKPKAKIAKPVEKKGKDKKTEVAMKHQETVGTEMLPKEKDKENKTEVTEEEDDDLIMCPITDDSPEEVFVEVTKKKDKGKSSKSMIVIEDLPKLTETKEIEMYIKKPETLPAIEKPEDTSKSGTEVSKQTQKKCKKGKQPISEVQEPLKAENKEDPKASEMSLAFILNPPKATESPTTTEGSKEKSIATKEPSKTEETAVISSPVEKAHPKKEPKAIPMTDFATDMPLATKEPEIIISIKSVEETKMHPESILSHDNITIPEQETGKKRKKSPKPSRKPDSDTKDDSKVEPSKVTEGTFNLNILEPNLSKTMPPIEKKIPKLDVDETKSDTKPVNLTSLESNITHTQASAQTPTDISTDMIETPRSTSADIIDSNNNMMIQEINTTSKFAVPIVIPETVTVSGSGESPELMLHRIKLTEAQHVGSSLEIVEKTDVKSKMMEVNQDMEDLRLSIEKSLAELTALEKKDEEFGIKPFETKIIDAGAKKETLHPLTPIQEAEILFKLPSDLVREQKSADIMLTKTDVPQIPAAEMKTDTPKTENITKTESSNVPSIISSVPPVCPSRKDNKGKNKSKKTDKQVTNQPTSTSGSKDTPVSQSKDGGQETKKEEKSEQQDKTKSQEERGKQQSDSLDQKTTITEDKPAADNSKTQFDPIENFEDAMTSSADDVNKSFEIIANESSSEIIVVEQKPNPEINVTEPDEVDKGKDNKINPIVSQPKNLLGHPVIPARSSKMDYKKEKNKTPNLKQAKVKIKDASELDKTQKESKESQTENKPKLINNKGLNESVTCVTSENDEYVYKYSFRKVFLSSNCHVCKKELKENRVACNFCNIMFYCSKKHKDDDFPQHQAFCFAVSSICHLKGQKHIYAETQGVSGHEYRLLRMQLIVSCERILKRKLAPSEQEALLYPRVCADGSCREWRMGQLKDCTGCGQISHCASHPEHLPKSHPRWCASYKLYERLVVHQLTRGRLEPRLPARGPAGARMCDNINRLLADMYDERIDMNDVQYAALTQLATAPLTAAFSHQLYRDKMKSAQANGVHKSPTLTIHVVGAELQFEADSLHKWEVFFLHLRPDVLELRVTLVGPELNPSNLPLDLLGNIKLCPGCRVDRRRVVFEFQDKLLYHQYRNSDDFVLPDLVCAFNPSIHRSASASHSSWAPVLDCIFKLKAPFCVTSYSMSELQRDLAYIKEHTQVEFNTVSEAKFNPFASVRPDRNFITDDEIPLLFKNYCYGVLIGAF